MVDLTKLRARIVVGVDASAAARAAVLWAAQEARFRRLSLIVTHISATGIVGSSDAWGAADHRDLSAAAAVASQREPGIAVGTQLLIGDVGDELIRLSRHAAMLVVGVDRSRPRAASGLTDMMVDSIIAHAACPVVTVSDGPLVSEGLHRHVVVAWPADTDEPSALEAAVIEAGARSAALTIVTERSVGRRSADGTPGGADQLLQVQLGALSGAQPELRVTVDSNSPDLAGELHKQSTGADLLLVGFRQRDDRWSIDNAELAALMIWTADCPVMLVPTSARADLHLRPAA